MADTPIRSPVAEAVAELRQYGSHVLRQGWSPDHLKTIREAIVRHDELRAQRIARGEAQPYERMMHTHGSGLFSHLVSDHLLAPGFLAEMLQGTPYHRICVAYLEDEELYAAPSRLGFRMHDPLKSDRSFVPFHQDSGTQDRRVRDVLNCWIPLDPDAGSAAPGLEVVRDPCEPEFPLKDFGLASENAVYDYITIDPEAVKAAYGDRLLAPQFDIGDGLVFTQDVIHRTHVTPQMTKPRYNFEFRVFSLKRLAPGASADEVRDRAIRVA